MRRWGYQPKPPQVPPSPIRPLSLHAVPLVTWWLLVQVGSCVLW